MTRSMTPEQARTALVANSNLLAGRAAAVKEAACTTASPALSDLIDAGGHGGLRLRNPDNGVEFRAKYAEAYGLSFVKLYLGNARRVTSTRRMNREDIEHWLTGLVAAVPTEEQSAVVSPRP